jgi:hypothetical protein
MSTQLVCFCSTHREVGMVVAYIKHKVFFMMCLVKRCGVKNISSCHARLEKRRKAADPSLTAPPSKRVATLSLPFYHRLRVVKEIVTFRSLPRRFESTYCQHESISYSPKQSFLEVHLTEVEQYISTSRNAVN